MPCIPTSKPRRRYLYRLIPTMVTYLALVFFAKWAFQHLHPSGLVVYLLAIIPALPLVGSLAVVGLYIAEESDEFERSVVIQAMLWGIGGALSLSTIWRSLEDFANAPHISTLFFYIFFWVFAAISQPIIRLRYR